MKQKPIIVVHVNSQIPQLQETMEMMSEQLNDPEVKIFLVANSNLKKDIEFECLNPVPVSEMEYRNVIKKLEKLEKEVRDSI